MALTRQTLCRLLAMLSLIDWRIEMSPGGLRIYANCHEVVANHTVRSAPRRPHTARDAHAPRRF